ncbi:uncharacterized protein LOC132803556 [Ziziphus jujuba]|uniref:Uncharacterized protein LOC132803556 n=1 Tax=Ziziphus jujuba TaxID=326968 RepID=A0ABM4A7Q3_ZIZJJ|nr:uncharacterized protein LOC132803556 [Ziziphus jujuba]
MPEIALSVSERINIETPERPDLVLGLLKDHGFTNTHISRLVKDVSIFAFSQCREDPFNFAINVSILRALGVTHSFISALITGHPYAACRKTSMLEKMLRRSLVNFRSKMDIFVNKLGFSLETWPEFQVLEKRIIPRCSVIKVLLS